MEFDIYKGASADLEKEETRQFNGHLAYTGFPNQASDCLRERLDWNDKLCSDKNETYTLEIKGGPFSDCSLQEGDLLVVNTLLVLYKYET